MSDTSKAEKWSRILKTYQILSENPRQNQEIVTKYIEIMVDIIQDFTKSGLVEKVEPIKSMYNLGLKIETVSQILWIITNEQGGYAIEITDIKNWSEVISSKVIEKETILAAIYEYVNPIA